MDFRTSGSILRFVSCLFQIEMYFLNISSPDKLKITKIYKAWNRNYLYVTHCAVFVLRWSRYNEIPSVSRLSTVQHPRKKLFRAFLLENCATIFCALPNTHPLNTLHIAGSYPPKGGKFFNFAHFACTPRAEEYGCLHWKAVTTISPQL